MERNETQTPCICTQCHIYDDIVISYRFEYPKSEAPDIYLYTVLPRERHYFSQHCKIIFVHSLKHLHLKIYF